MVVPVLMTSCQFSEKPKSGPVTAQATITSSAAQKAVGDPAQRVTPEAKRSKAVSRGEWLAAYEVLVVDGIAPACPLPPRGAALIGAPAPPSRRG